MHLEILVDEIAQIDLRRRTGDRPGGCVAPATAQDLEEVIEHGAADDVRYAVNPSVAHDTDHVAFDLRAVPGDEVVGSERTDPLFLRGASNSHDARSAHKGELNQSRAYAPRGAGDQDRLAARKPCAVEHLLCR